MTRAFTTNTAQTNCNTLRACNFVLKSLPARFFWGGTRWSSRRNQKGKKGAAIIYISVFSVQVERVAEDAEQHSPSPRRKKKEGLPVCPPSVDPDQPHPLSLCDPDRSCPDVRLRHNGGKETALAPRLCPSRCGSVCLLLHQKQKKK